MGDWNDYLVEVIGNRYRSRLNGVQMVDFTDPKPTSFDGNIALQLHAGGRGNMEFKDIWIPGPVASLALARNFREN